MKILIIAAVLFISGSLWGQTDFIFVFLNKKIDKEVLPKEQLDKIMEGHMANIQRLAEEDKLIVAGPFDGGGGIFVFKSSSIEQVQDWLATDPGVKANRWNIEILSYKPIAGSICKVGEDTKMISYQFIRFWPEVKKYNVSDAATLIDDHQRYWKKYNAANTVITFASFGGEEGDILITAQPVDENILVNDPSIAKGLMRFDKKTLWIAKGSFCEQ